MSLTSYASNFEDVMLWRALGGVKQGCYLDVGAAGPAVGSVSQLFYARGWRGINLEPSSSHWRQLCIARPADINLPLAAAGAAGKAPFYETPGAGSSTFDAARAEQLRAGGQAVVLREVELVTLDDVCQQHLDGALHFLHIGAADATAVLAGFDLARWRPWIVVLCADAAPEALAALASAGYTQAYQDGWKQYFVAAEQAALAAALRLPPHPEDGFVLCEDHAYSFPLDNLRERASRAEQEAQEARQWSRDHVREWQQKYQDREQQRERGDVLEQELERVRAVVEEQAGSLEHNRLDYLEQQAVLSQRLREENERAAQAEQQLSAVQGQLNAAQEQARQELSALHTQFAAAQAHIQAQAQAQVHAQAQRDAIAAQASATEATLWAVYNSLSWRLTRPLRASNHFVHRAVGYLRRFPGRVRRALVRRVKWSLGAAFNYVNRRPRLSFFLRRTISRLPFLVPLARSLHMRLKLNNSNAPAMAPAAAPPADVVAQVEAGIVVVRPDLNHLPDAARRMFDDLRRRAPHS